MRNRLANKPSCSPGATAGSNDGATSDIGPTRTSRHVRFSAARGGEADISRRILAVAIYEYAPESDGRLRPRERAALTPSAVAVASSACVYCGDLSPSNSCTAIIGTMVEIVLL